ncbi:MAG TPA: SPFH domain-containing protein [Sedimentisphaerales bacterium]|nr:SPFH domain-containing protein [Sedimentisphaerales bacterium]
MTISSRRAEYLARASLALSLLFFIITLLIGLWSEFFAVFAVSWLVLAAVLIWFALCLQFHQRALAEQEKLDITQLARDKKASAIFQAGQERATLFAVAQRRLQILEKWFIPIFAAIIGVYELAIGLYLLQSASGGADIEPKQPLLIAVFMTAIAFVSFLMSRYAIGMSAQPQWKPLRAGGSFLLGVAVLCFALAVALALVQFKNFVFIIILNWAIPILLVLLGAETGLNVLLDMYRPRLKGQYHRSAFDSRLLGLISEPGGILRTAASAIDYQFGFKVSQTWFYKLLEKAIVPLILFAGVTLYLLSCIIVVAPNEEAIIEHFGNPLTKAGQKRIAGPGLTFKWPWPIDIAHKYPTKRISELHIGYVPKVDPRTGEAVREPLLWGRAHYEEEYHLLVASRQTGAASITGAAPVSLVIAAIPVQYRIKDLYSYIYNHNEPKKVLESICYRELTRFAASAKVEVDSQEDMDHSLFGAGRAEAKRILVDRIQEAADGAGLGVEIVFVGVQGIHPPPEVAVDYQKVVAAVQKKQAAILDAEAYRNKILSSLAGSVEEADRLYDLAIRYQQAEKNNDQKGSEELGRQLDNAFTETKGDIFAKLRKAHSYAFEKATLARATGERFASQVKAYDAAEKIYVREQILAAFEEGLKNIRKFVVVADQNDSQVFIVDVQEKLTPSLYDITGLKKESSGK